jgi:TM2 domain-containing membrane protein YozV
MTYREEPDVATLGPNKKHCYACASILDVRAELCPKCGVRQPVLPAMMPGMQMAMVPVQSALPATTRNKTSAALLALFVGAFGIHKFYLGQSAAGIVYLLFCWTFIPAIIAFVEALILFGMNDADFARKYPG